MAKAAKKLDQLFHDTLKDIYFAEKKILSTLPKMAKAAHSRALKAAFEKHHGETEGHVTRPAPRRLVGVNVIRRSTASRHARSPAGREPIAHEDGQHLVVEVIRQHDRFGVAVRATPREQPESPALFRGEARFLWDHRHFVPVSVSRGGSSCQFGRASAPMIPHLEHAMRGPNHGTGVSSDHASALRIPPWGAR